MSIWELDDRNNSEIGEQLISEFENQIMRQGEKRTTNSWTVRLRCLLCIKGLKNFKIDRIDTGLRWLV